MPESPLFGIDATPPSPPVSSPPPVIDAPAGGGASRGGGTADDSSRARRLRALATEIETLPTTHAAFARLLTVAVESLQGAGAWVGLTMEDSDALVVVAAHGEVPVEAGARVPRDRAFAARALTAHAAVFADPSTGVRWSDTVIARVPVRAVAAPLLVDGEHAVGVISIIGGPGRLFTVADGTFAHATGFAGHRWRCVDAIAVRRYVADGGDGGSAPIEAFVATAAARCRVSRHRGRFRRRDHPSPRRSGTARREHRRRATGDRPVSMRFPAALGALAALRGVRTPLDVEHAEHLSRQRRTVQLPDARHLVPERWRSLVPALPGASIALIDNDVAVGRVDIVFDPDRAVPHAATRRIEQQAGTLARALSRAAARVARAPTDPGLESLHALRSTLAARLHDLTSPIAGISALSELLSEEDLSPEILELVTLIQRSARRAAEAASTLPRARRCGPDHAAPIRWLDGCPGARRAARTDSRRSVRSRITRPRSTVDPAHAVGAHGHSRRTARLGSQSAMVASETALLGSARRRIDVRAALDGGLAVLTVADDGVPLGIVPSEWELHGATISVIRTDDGRTIRRLAIPLRIGSPQQLP
ncbi:MAG: hypothetical protein U5K74_11380 [Gemmatimonadaceae bacterium]|nr:hypothetical protein [Gemmatimonadaceae bacterium]